MFKKILILFHIFYLTTTPLPAISIGNPTVLGRDLVHGGILALGGAALYYTNPNNIQTSGDGQGLGYIVMLGNDFGYKHAPTEPYQKELFFQILPALIEKHLPKTFLCFVDKVSLQEWAGCYQALANAGVTKVINIVYAHGSKLTAISGPTAQIADRHGKIIFDATLKRRLFDRHSNITHELVLLSCFAGNIDVKTLGIPVFSASKPYTDTWSPLTEQWIDFLAHSNHAIPTSAQEFYEMYNNFGASVTMTGGFFINSLLDYSDLTYHIPYIRTLHHASLGIINDFLWPLQSFVRIITQTFEPIMPLMPLYQDPNRNITLGHKMSHLDYINWGGIFDGYNTQDKLALNGIMNLALYAPFGFFILLKANMLLEARNQMLQQQIVQQQ